MFFGYYQSNDSSAGLYILGFFVLLLVIGWIWGAITSHIDERAKTVADAMIAARKHEIDQHANKARLDLTSEKDRALEIIRKQKEFLTDSKKELAKGYIQGRKWLAGMMSEAEIASEKLIEFELRTKPRPALKAAEAIKLANQKRRDAVQRAKFVEYQLASYKEYFPALDEYEEAILQEVEGFNRGLLIDEVEDKVDPAAAYLAHLPRQEYDKLSPAERNQRALDAYRARHKSNWEIGRQYERFLGYIYERNEWDVTFHGIFKGLEDMGRDLICRRGSEIHVVQAKCWSQSKIIYEKYLFQLFASSVHFSLSEKAPVSAMFATTTSLSESAKEVAERLGVAVWEQKLDAQYPMIKCNINQDDRIYHLPFDQQYDRVKIRPSTGEFYALTIEEAEKEGFRRAKRHYYQT